MIRPLPAAVLLVAVASAVGCKGSGPLVRDAPTPAAVIGFPNHSVPQILAELTRAAPIGSFESQARIAIRSEQMNQDVTATIRARRSDSLLAMVRGPFGIEVGRALVTPDSVFALDKVHGRLYLGPAALAERYVPGSAGPDALFGSLLGLTVPGPGAGWRVHAEAESYVLENGYETMSVDPALWRVTRYEGRDAEGRVVDQRTFDAFDTVDSVVVARRVRLSRPDVGASVTIEHRKLKLNPEVLRFSFAPGDADRRTLD